MYYKYILPSSNHSIAYFRQHIDLLHDLISMYSQVGTVIIIGDFNAHLNGSVFIKQIASRGNALSELTSIFDLINISTSSFCIGADTSYVSYDHHNKSLIDHVITSDELVHYIVYCIILDDDCLNVSSHRPIVFKLQNY